MAAFAWSPIGTHPALMSNAIHDPAVYALAQEFLTAGQIDAISGFTGDGFDPYHGNWSDFENRTYCTNPLWTGLTDETTKLQYLMHNATDSGVPAGHSPANRVYIDSTAEALLEFQVAFWSTYPDVRGTSVFSSSRLGAFNYTGTYFDVVNAHIAAVTANAADFKNGASNHDVGWAGTTQAQLFARAFIADYLLQKRPTVANAGASYTANPGGSVTFSAAGSQDPDSISWANNGAFSNNGGGLLSYEWDLDGDGNYGDVTGVSPNVSYSDLVDLVGYTPGKLINLRVTDDEASVGYASATLAVLVPEPGTLVMLLAVAFGLLAYAWRRRRS